MLRERFRIDASQVGRLTFVLRNAPQVRQASDCGECRFDFKVPLLERDLHFPCELTTISHYRIFDPRISLSVGDMPKQPSGTTRRAPKNSGRRLSLRRVEYKVAIQLIKEMRAEANLTQEQVAEQLNAQQSFLSKIENRDRRLDIIELRDLCILYGVDLMHFVGRLEERLTEEHENHKN
jgi:DNA-binding XRE family transcriptional regulator